MKTRRLLLFVVVFSSCSKSRNEPTTIVCPEPSEAVWIVKLKAEYASCVCPVVFYRGVYQNQPVLEPKLNAPLCNGVNAVYKMDGSLWFTSADNTTYTHYTSNVKQSTVIWTCSSGRQ